MPALMFTDPSGQHRRFELKRKLTSIGRGRTCDLTLADPTLLPIHAHVLVDGSRCRIAGLEEDAKVYVNGRTRRTHRLKHGDIIKLGQTEISFEEKGAETAAGPKLVPSSPPPSRAEAKAGSAEVVNLQSSPLFEQLHRFSEQLLGGNDLPVLFKVLLDTVVEVTKADKGFLIIARDGQLEIPAARNVDRVDLPDDPSQISDSVINRALKERRPIVVANTLEDTVLGQARSVVDLKLSSVMCVPLLAKDVLMGGLYVGKDTAVHPFDERSLSVLTIFAGQASLILQNALLLNQVEEDNRRLRQQLGREVEGGRMVGGSPPMKTVFRTLARVAPTDISVLITGETGTGKELVAREIHDRSDRASGPFVSVNCGAIPENLLESELFGHKKGSFTGALSDRKGRFELAHGGTLFLDEIGEMPAHLQVKLLRVLQERAIDPVGSTRSVSVDIRILSATNKNLEEEIRERRFREDLYYRLNEINVQLPPLRERGEDILLIAQHLLRRYEAMYQSSVRGFSNEATRAMRAYFWPGNIRQLENRIKKAVVMSEGPLVSPMDLGFASEAPARDFLPLAQARDDFQMDYVREALEANNWNKAATARMLDVDARTIFRYVERLKDD